MGSLLHHGTLRSASSLNFHVTIITGDSLLCTVTIKAYDLLD